METTGNTSFEDIDSDTIQTHILPLLDGPSLSNTSYVSHNLKSICSDHHLWSRISKSTWPSIVDPRVDDVISTFRDRHLSFYNDSYPSLVLKDVSHINLNFSTSKKGTTSSCYHMPNEIVSAVDIRYENEIVYSTVKVTETSSAEFFSSGLKIELPGKGISRTIDLTIDDEFSGPGRATLSRLKESLTLNWILIDPALKRAGNFSSIKPVSVKQYWATYETHVRYVTILPGHDPNEIVKCRIHLALGVGKGGIGLHVKEIRLKFEDFNGCYLNGRDFLVTMQGAIMEENNVIRRVATADEENSKIYNVFKEMKKVKKDLLKQKQSKKEVVNNFGYYVALLWCFFISLYFVTGSVQ